MMKNLIYFILSDEGHIENNVFFYSFLKFLSVNFQQIFDKIRRLYHNKMF